MGDARTRSITPDLFSTAASRGRWSLSANPPKSLPSTVDAAAVASSPRHVLPNDLPNAIKHLEDHELDRLLAAVLAEQQRRGKKHSAPDDTSRKQNIKDVALPLTVGKLNAVRASFKAGVSPSRIARQFGISLSDVRKALAGERSKRAPSRG
jgi:hypothetical protein